MALAPQRTGKWNAAPIKFRVVYTTHLDGSVEITDWVHRPETSRAFQFTPGRNEQQTTTTITTTATNTTTTSTTTAVSESDDPQDEWDDPQDESDDPQEGGDDTQATSGYEVEYIPTSRANWPLMVIPGRIGR